MAFKLHPSLVTHPGEFLLEEFVKPYRLTIKEVAEHLGISRTNMSRLLNAKAALSPDMARRFEQAFGVSAATLLRMQVAYDLAQLELVQGWLDIERIPEPA